MFSGPVEGVADVERRTVGQFQILPSQYLIVQIDCFSEPLLPVERVGGVVDRLRAVRHGLPGDCVSVRGGVIHLR